MRAYLISSLLQALLLTLDRALIMRVLDALLDMVEDAVAHSETQLDDQLILPLCAKIRKELEIIDNDPA